MFFNKQARQKQKLVRALSQSEYNPGVLLVGFNNPLPEAHLIEPQSIGSTTVKKLSDTTARVHIGTDESLSDAITRLQAREDVKFAEPDYITHLYQDLNADETTGNSVTQDPLEIQQWWLKSAGFETAWQFSEGENVTVAVLDTGVDNTHPDLQGQILSGWNFVNNNTDTMDRHGHGCISPTDYVYTSLCGLQEIQHLYEKAPGMEFLTEDGAFVKNVSRYNLNTFSLNPSGETVPSKIEWLHKLPFQGIIYKIKTQEGSLSLTPWHPVYVKSFSSGKLKISKIRADELKIGQSIATSGKSKDIGLYVDIPFKTTWNCIFCSHQTQKNNSNRKYCRKCNQKNWTSGAVVEYKNLDEKLAFLCGLVASDGHLSQRSVEFCGNDIEIVNEFQKLSAEIFAKDCMICDDKRNLLLRRRINSVNIVNLLKNIGIPIGNKSLTMDFPEIIAKSPKSVVFSFIAGLIEGDGSVDKNGRIRLVTGSKIFAEKIVNLLRTLGERASVSCKFTPDYGFKSENRTYVVCISKNSECGNYLRVKKAKPSKTKPRNSAQILSIEKEEYNGLMYDFTVPKYHNYVANGFITSNTHTAGTIVALTNNNIGGAGAAFKSKVLAVKVLADNGSGSYSGLIQGIMYAADQGAKVISMSLGSPNASLALKEAISYATTKGCLIIAAAGNDGVTTPSYPGAYADLAVGAYDQTENRAWFSNYGAWVNIAAPGVNIVSTVPNSKYESMDGTSMATPQVAAAGALLFSKIGVTTPPHDIQQMMISSSRPCPWLKQVGSIGGLLDATRLLSMNSKPQIVKFNCGGATVQDFLSDATKFKGRAWIETHPNPVVIDTKMVTNPAPDEVYVSERVDPGSMQFTLVNGKYLIRLHFAEIFYHEPNKRIFNVLLNGQMGIENFDIIKMTGARWKAIVLEFDGEITNNNLTIEFQKVLEFPKVSGIEIIPIV